VVIDEIAGVWLAMACLPATAFAAHPWPWTLAATAAFRVVDILKPWPIDRCERLPGAVGVVADDLAAGVLAGGTCHLLKVLASP
jgi:phosphatidylglycerophosphatase A